MKESNHHSWEETFEDDVVLGQKVTPLDSAGLYIPGGTAAYPSTVLMAAIPAQAAGVERIVITSPPQKDGGISAGVLVAANEIGINGNLSGWRGSGHRHACLRHGVGQACG